ncbi:MAG TPA: hypothetical protein VFN10_19160 [Thermoanaerobaculia bacterium]|nr:hypothetical protein [Thermoanaerobaculia bacterium]
MDGFEVVRRIPEESRPLIVFVTAYQQYRRAARAKAHPQSPARRSTIAEVIVERLILVHRRMIVQDASCDIRAAVTAASSDHNLVTKPFGEARAAVTIHASVRSL